MSAKAEVLGVTSFEYNPSGEKSKTKAGKQLGVALIGSLGSVQLKRKVNDVTYTFKATETTFKNLRSFNGSTLTVSKPFGPITATGGLELGSVRSLNGTLKGKWTFEKKRAVELSAAWSEKTGATILSLVAQPHSQAKLTNRVNLKSNLVTSEADLAYRGYQILPAVNWKTGGKGISVTHKLRSGKLKGSYGFNNQVAGLEFDAKPYKVSVTGNVNGPFRPKLSLGFNQEFELSQVTDRVRGVRRDDSGRVPEVRRDIPLDKKLKELDALYEPKLKKAEARAARH